MWGDISPRTRGSDTVGDADVRHRSSITESSIPDSLDSQEPRLQERGPAVYLHIYHCDPYTGFLNRQFLKDAEMPIYHAGVEVYGEEWAFQYFEDAFNDDSISGVTRCYPKEMHDFEYQESVSLGKTPLTEEQVDRIINSLHVDWPAASYHLTRRNCLTFAERFVEMLQTPVSFPPMLKGILEAGERNPRTEAVVDWGWSWVKWWMLRKHALPEDRGSHGSSRKGEMSAGCWSMCVQPDSCARPSDAERGAKSLHVQPGD